jgi:hypothetical protein
MQYEILMRLNEAYRHGVYNEETLSEEEMLSIEEWVEALIEEGYDLDQYSDEELYKAYLSALDEEAPKRIIKSSKNPLLMKNAGPARVHNPSKVENNKRKEQKEELDLYDLVSEYLVSEGFCDSYEDADVIMANMSEEWREGIVEEVLDEAVKGSQRSLGNRITGNDIRQVRRGGSTIYKKPKWQDRVETGVRRDMGKEGHKNPYQYGSGATKQAKASVERMNAEKNVEVKHDYDGNDDVETVSTNSLSGYRTVPTNYRARRRRASGR